MSANTIPTKIVIALEIAFDSAHFVETKDACLVEPAGRVVGYIDIPTLSSPRRNDGALATRAENHCDEVRPLFARSPLGTIGGPLLHIAEYEPRRGAPWRGYARGFLDRQPGRGRERRGEGTRTGGPLRYLLRGCVPGRYYYLYHAHNSSRSLKLFYYLFYTPPLPDSARSPSYMVFLRHPWEHLQDGLRFLRSKSLKNYSESRVNWELLSNWSVGIYFFNFFSNTV